MSHVLKVSDTIHKRAKIIATINGVKLNELTAKIMDDGLARIEKTKSKKVRIEK